MPYDSHLHSLLKAISWRIFGTLATVLVVLIFTHEIKLSIYIGLFEFLSKTLLFYIHERCWIFFRWKLREK